MASPPVATPAASAPARPDWRCGRFIREPDARVRIDREALADAYGLTRQEAEVAGLIGEGLDPAATARHLSLATGTVRNYLKRVFEKTGVHSQAALLALARGFSSVR